jgi:WD40 repeat protein/serine/threonine protein kinase
MGSDVDDERDGRIDWAVGDRILGIYDVTDVHGQGGMGLVYRVRHLGWNTDLAVKSPRRELIRDRAGREGFVREAETWVSLGLHPHVCTCHYVRTLDGIPRVFAEYVPGGSLRDRIDDGRLYRGDERRVLARVLDTAIQVAWGLAHAHRLGVAHLDVKPANVLIGAADTAKLTDFGLARGLSTGNGPLPADDPDRTGTVRATGGWMTRAYASPEQAAGRSPGRRSDVWSFAVSVLEMLTGEITWLAGPAAGEALTALREDPAGAGAAMAVPAALLDVLERCLRADPADRPRDMAQIAAELAGVFADEVGQAYPRTVPEPAEMRAAELSNRALSYLDLGRTDEAVAAFERARTIDPRHPEVTYNLGLLRWRAGEITDDALVRALEQATSGDDPGRTRPLLARVHLERGDHDAARSHLGAGDPPPEDEDIRQALAWEHPGNVPVALNGRAEPIGPARVTPDGRHVISAGSVDGSALYVWDLATRTLVRTLRSRTGSRTGGQLTALDVTADGRHVVVAGGIPGREKARILDLATGRRVGTLRGKVGPVTRLHTIPDGRHVLTVDVFTRGVRVWDMRTGRHVRTLEEGAPALNAVCPMWDGRHVLTVCGGWERDRPGIRMWDLTTGELVRVMEPDSPLTSALALMPDGRHALAAFAGEGIWVLDLATGERVRVFGRDVDTIQAIGVSPDGRYAVTTGDRTMRLWQIGAGRCLRTRETGELIHFVQVATDGRQAVTAGLTGPVRLWPVDPETAPSGFRICRPHSAAELTRLGSRVDDLIEQAEEAIDRGDLPAALSRLRSARAQPGHERAPAVMDAWHRLAVRTRRGRIRTAWSTRTFEGHAGSVNAVDVTPDGRYVLSAGADRTVRIWDLTGEDRVRTLQAHTDVLTSVCVLPDGGHALTAGLDGVVREWELASGSCVRTLEAHVGAVHGVAVTPDGSHALSAGSDHTVRVWNLAEGTCSRILEGHTDRVNSVCVRPDGRHALTAGSDGVVREWDLSTGACTRFLEMARAGGMRSACVTPDGRWALTTRDFVDRKVRMIDLATGRRIRTLEGHLGGVKAVTVTPDGSHAVSAGSDGTVRLWDLAGGECVHVLEGHTGEVNCVCVTPDGRYAVSGGADRVLHVWEIDWELAAR